MDPEDDYFANDDASKFQYFIEGTSLECCLVASGLARHGKALVQADRLLSYGGLDTSVSLKEIRDIENLDGVCEFRISLSDDSDSESGMRLHSHIVDVVHPKILLGSSRSIRELVRLGVSGYISFHGVRSLIVSGWTIPLTRSQVFADKHLRMQEKRGLMELLKNVAASSNSVIHSSSVTGGGSDPDCKHTASADINALQFLHNFHITRPELIVGLIHGVCLFPGPTSSLSSVDFVVRMAQFAESLNVYEGGIAFLVPTYGNGDLPQAFARAAAVAGAVQILGCDIPRIQQEIANSGKCESVHVLRPENTTQVQRAVILNRLEAESDPSQDESVSLEIVPPTSVDDYPIFCLNRRKAGSYMFDIFTFSQDTERFRADIENFINSKGIDPILKVTFSVNVPYVNSLHAFSLESELDNSMRTVNSLIGLAQDEPLPGPLQCQPDNIE